jgi:hypothetical protein
MTDSDLTLDPLAGALPVEPARSEPTAPEAPAAEQDTVAADPMEPPAPPAPPPLSAEELAAIAAAAPTPTAEELTALAPAAETALPLGGVTTGVPVTPPSPDVAAPTASKPSRRRRLRGWTLKLVTSLFSLAFFVVGVTFGSTVYQRVQPPPPVIGDPSTGGVETPPVVQELVTALVSNNADSLRSAVNPDPYRYLTGELQSWSLQGVNSVETLATMKDGPRSATEIVIIGKAPNGDPVVFNLVVHVDDNQIVSFR